MTVNQQKLKLLHVAKMLMEETDAEHGLSMPDILERLAEKGVAAERKAIYRDLDALREFGLPIETLRRAPVEYALVARPFDLSELALLIDAVQSSRFLTQRNSNALVKSIRALASAPQRAQLDKQVHVTGRVSAQNESVFCNVDIIQRALSARRKLRFRYFRYDANKRRAFRHNGDFYCETPVQLVYSDGAYYLVAYNEKHDSFPHYRVDRMCNIEVSDEAVARGKRVAAYDVHEAESRAFGMYSGEETAVVLRAEERAMNAVIDRFGKEVEAVAQPDGTARVYVTVMKSPVFFGWLAQFGNDVRIERPAALAQEYAAYLRAIVESYDGEGR